MKIRNLRVGSGRVLCTKGSMEIIGEEKRRRKENGFPTSRQSSVGKSSSCHLIGSLR